MLSRKLTYKPEADFELQFSDLIDNIRGLELVDLPPGFERQFFNYLYSTRPRQISTSSFLEHAASEIRNATYEVFDNLINLLTNFLRFESSPSDESVSYMKVEESIKLDISASREMQLFGPEQDFYSALMTKLNTDMEFRNRLKTDKILSEKIWTVFFELNFTEAQRAEIEKYLSPE